MPDAVTGLGRLQFVKAEEHCTDRPIDGSPRTVAICVGSEEMPHVCVGETSPVWSEDPSYGVGGLASEGYDSLG